PAPGVGAVGRDDSTPLHRLSVEGLTVRYPSSGRGVQGVDLAIDAGSITVIAGEVGAGKSTLVSALLVLGLHDSGVIECNGAFLRDADLVVVDDPSSALDVETEERMWARLLERSGRTLLIVSNRPEVIARADQVLVLVNGLVVT